MDIARKKAIVDSYKNKTTLGGVYCIECTSNGKKWIHSTTDLASIKNRYDFSVSIHSCPEPYMREDWNNYGEKAFVFSVVESLKRGEEQSEKDYAADLCALLDVCRAKLLS